MLDNYPIVEKFIQGVSKDFQKIFGGNLVAVYVTGSLTTHSYIEGLSDIDMIAVIHEKASPLELENLKTWAKNLLKNEPLSAGLDVSMVQRKNVMFSEQEPEEALEFYNGEINYAKNALGNSPIVWDQILQNGIILFGLEPKEIINTIPWEKIKNALKNEALTIQERVDLYFHETKFRYYVLTTLCRIMYTIQNKSYLPKKGALEWYLTRYGLHEELVRAAVAYIQGDENLLMNTQKEEYKKIVAEVLDALVQEVV